MRPSPRVVIVGAGFGGLQCARALRDKPVDVTLVDRHNYHLFTPLLYQVASCLVASADDRGVVLRDGHEVSTATMVWTAGVQPNDPLHVPARRLDVDDHMRPHASRRRGRRLRDR